VAGLVGHLDSFCNFIFFAVSMLARYLVALCYLALQMNKKFSFRVDGSGKNSFMAIFLLACAAKTLACAAIFFDPQILPPCCYPASNI